MDEFIREENDDKIPRPAEVATLFDNRETIFIS